MTVLDEILTAKRDEVTLLHRPSVLETLRKTALEAPSPRDFADALRAPDGSLAVIAEIKRRSPSKGPFQPDLDAATTAKAYEAGGAACLSVLTDAVYFGGSVDDLQTARGATEIPVLRKDFTIDEVQVYESRAIGADAVLLIVSAIPDDALLADLHMLATALHLAVLVEVHTEEELDRALRAGARVVGVNSRDLATFAEDLSIAERLVAAVPADVIAVAESAIRAPDDARRMADAGFDAVLVGEALVLSADPTSAVRQLTELPTRHRG